MTIDPRTLKDAVTTWQKKGTGAFSLMSKEDAVLEVQRGLTFEMKIPGARLETALTAVRKNLVENPRFYST